MKSFIKFNKKRLFFKCIFIFIFFILYFVNSKIAYNNKIFDFKITYNNKALNRIFILSLYNNEAEMAYIHLWRLYDYVDKFIFVVSNITYSGHPKNISFGKFEKNIRKYINKVDIVYFNNICNKKEYPNSNYIWCLENSQRDFAKTFIEQKYNPTNKDLLIVVDIDEILTREGINYIKNNPPDNFKFIKGTYYFPYYYHKILDWDRGYVVRYNNSLKTLSKYRLMRNNNNSIIKFDYNPKKPLITHCSYCFKNIEEFRNKLTSFSHQEYNRPPYITNNWIFKSHYCREIFKYKGEDEPYEGWENLIPDDDRLKYLIDRSFMYNISQTTFKKSDLKILCFVSYNRTPFEFDTKYKYFDII